MRKVLVFMCAVLALESCLRDEIPQCPTLSIDVAVKDKNYFNVRKVELEEARSENLPFREYVPTIYYQLRRLDSGELVMQHALSEVTDDGETFPIRYCTKLQHGTYVLTVWGGMKDMEALDDSRTVADLHPEGTEGEDVYMTCDTLVYDAYNYNYTVEMERTKGKLIIQAVDLPSDIAWSDKTGTQLYRTVDRAFHYSGETGVKTESEWTPAKEVVTKTLLSPSLHKNGTTLKVNFYDAPERIRPVAVPDDVKVTMKRNELAVLRYVYEDGRFSIYMLVNDDWEKVHGMVID